MDKVTEYLNNNPQYVTALIVTAVIIAAATVLGYFIVKYNLLRFMDGWFKRGSKTPAPTTDVSAETNGNLPEVADESAYEGESSNGDDNGDSTNALQNDESSLSSADDDLIDENKKKRENDASPVENGEEVETPAEKESEFSKKVKLSLESDAFVTYEIAKNEPRPAAAEKQQTPPEPEQIPADEPIEEEGKWRILRVGSAFVAGLYGDDDVLLVNTPQYSSVSGAKNAIENLKKNVKGNNFTVSVNRDGKYYFKLYSPSNRLICEGTPCETSSDCKKNIEDVKRVAFTAQIVRG